MSTSKLRSRAVEDDKYSQCVKDESSTESCAQIWQQQPGNMLCIFWQIYQTLPCRVPLGAAARAGQATCRHWGEDVRKLSPTCFWQTPRPLRRGLLCGGPDLRLGQRALLPVPVPRLHIGLHGLHGLHIGLHVSLLASCSLEFARTIDGRRLPGSLAQTDAQDVSQLWHRTWVAVDALQTLQRP